VQSCHGSLGDTEIILRSISSRSLQSMSLDYCAYKASSFKDFLKRHSETLKGLTLKRTSLHGCRLEELFRFMCENMSIGNVALEGYLAEYKADPALEPYDDPGDLELTLELRERGDLAKRSITNFITRRSDNT
jgi:hypothetical protein